VNSSKTEGEFEKEKHLKVPKSFIFFQSEKHLARKISFSENKA